MPSGNSYFNQIGMRGVASVKHRRLHNQNKVLKPKKSRGMNFYQLSLQNFEIAFDIENVLIEDGGLCALN